MMMYYWVHDVKAKHVMLFEDIANWDIIVNYNNFFCIECHNWLINQQVELGGFDRSGHPTYIEVDELCFDSAAGVLLAQCYSPYAGTVNK